MEGRDELGAVAITEDSRTQEEPEDCASHADGDGDLLVAGHMLIKG
jgi:hypothetical protein